MRKTRTILFIVASSLMTLALGCGQNRQAESVVSIEKSESNIKIATWNIRGYPEKQQENRDWLHQQLEKMSPDIICIQEIANQNSVNQFLSNENSFTQVAFNDSPDSQDNAIFSKKFIGLEDIPDPPGFQHPAQSAYLSYDGFDATIVTVHLSWTNIKKREQEKNILKSVVIEALKRDPDVIITGDFNTEEEGMQELAQSIGMIVIDTSNKQGTTHAGNRYDYFLCSPDLANEEIVSCWIETFTGADLEKAKAVSDHLPVQILLRTEEGYRDRK